MLRKMGELCNLFPSHLPKLCSKISVFSLCFEYLLRRNPRGSRRKEDGKERISMCACVGVPASSTILWCKGRILVCVSVSVFPPALLYSYYMCCIYTCLCRCSHQSYYIHSDLILYICA